MTQPLRIARTTILVEVQFAVTLSQWVGMPPRVPAPLVPFRTPRRRVEPVAQAWENPAQFDECGASGTHLACASRRSPLWDRRCRLWRMLGASLHAVPIALEHGLLHVGHYLLALRLGETARAQQLFELLRQRLAGSPCRARHLVEHVATPAR